MSVIFSFHDDRLYYIVIPLLDSGGHRSKFVFPKSRTAKRPKIPVATDTWISGSRFPILPPEPSRKISHCKLKTCWMIICIIIQQVSFSLFTQNCIYLVPHKNKISAIFFQKNRIFSDFSDHKTRFSILNTLIYSNSTCGSRDFSCRVTDRRVSLMRVHKFPVIG